VTAAVRSSQPGGSAMSNLDALEVLAFALVSLTSRAIAAETRSRQLTFQQWRAIVVLGAAAAPLRVSELGARVAASPPSASRIVRRLEAHDLVEVAPDPRDRRAVGVRLTPAGLDLRARVVARRRELIRLAIGDAQARQPVPENAGRIVEALSRLA